MDSTKRWFWCTDPRPTSHQTRWTGNSIVEVDRLFGIVRSLAMDKDDGGDLKLIHAYWNLDSILKFSLGSSRLFPLFLRKSWKASLQLGLFRLALTTDRYGQWNLNEPKMDANGGWFHSRTKRSNPCSHDLEIYVRRNDGYPFFFLAFPSGHLQSSSNADQARLPSSE